MVSAQETPEINLNPSHLNLSINDTFTMTAFLSNFPSLYAWEVVFKYNGSVVNLTAIWLPDNNILSGYSYISVPPPTDVEAAGDVQDHLNWTAVGASLVGDVSVAVSNGSLFQANFTVVGFGQTTIAVATIDSPALSSAGSAGNNAWYTFVQTPADADRGSGGTTAFMTTGCSVGNVPPQALLTIFSPPVDNRTYLILNRNIPPGIVNWRRAYEGLPVYFNASASYAPSGTITAYIWNFGDGNITRVNATGAPADSIITHVYQAVGIYYMNLTVVGNGTIGKPAPISLPASYVILVDLVLEYYDWSWFIYAIVALVAAVTVIAAARSAVRRARRRSKLKGQKTLTAGPSGMPPTGAQTT
jgi:hypothetical protein